MEFEWDQAFSGNGSTAKDITLGPAAPACKPIPAYHPTFIIVMQASVSMTTLLSILGSVLIVGTFIAFKNLRTRARQLLVQLSIADFAAAASQLVGVNANLENFAAHICIGQEQADLNVTNNMLCKVQGGITIFFTVSSFFWTVAVAIYLLTIIVFESPTVGKWLAYLSYPICWGVPAMIVMAFGLRQSIGFHANVDTGEFISTVTGISECNNFGPIMYTHYVIYR
jgi:G protein-coupled receptor 157